MTSMSRLLQDNFYYYLYINEQFFELFIESCTHTFLFDCLYQLCILEEDLSSLWYTSLVLLGHLPG